MKKAIAKSVIAFASFSPIGAETLEQVERSSERVSEYCKPVIEEMFGDDLTVVVRENNERAIEEDVPTSTEARTNIQESEIAHYPLLETYAKQQTNYIGTYPLAKSGVTLSFHSDNPWDIDPEGLETLVETSYHTAPKGGLRAVDQLATAGAKCLSDDIFLRRDLAGYHQKVVIIGKGEKCISHLRVIPRGIIKCGSGNYDYSTITYDGVIYILPRGEGDSEKISRSASRIIVHELDHVFRQQVGYKKLHKKLREYTARQQDQSSSFLLKAMDYPPLQLKIAS